MRVIAHLSDIHFGRLQPTLVAVLASTIIGLRADLLAVSGDLTQRARKREFAAARHFLDSLPVPRLVLPGNHDVPLYNVIRRFVTPLARYKRAITDDLSPVYRDDEMIVVGVNTARSFTWGEGRMNEQQADAIARTLSGAPPHLIRIVVTHHPFDLPAGVPEGRLLGGAARAMAKLAAARADLFLAGHLHISHVGHTAQRYRIAGHSALVVQAGTVSTRSRGEQPSFNVLRIADRNISVERRVWDPASGSFSTVAAGTYSHTADGWMAVDPPSG
jgi:3',5'-cyclic AMP phosphodiesterase CpdA